MEHSPQGHAPAEADAAALERCAQEETVAQVVHEVANQHRGDDAGLLPGGPALRLLTLLVLGLFRSRFCHKSCCGVEHIREEEAKEHHGAPAPNDVRLLGPALTNKVSGLEQQQEEGTRNERAGSKAAKHTLKHGSLGFSKLFEAGQDEDYSDQSDNVDKDGSADRGAPLGVALLLLRGVWVLCHRLNVLPHRVLEIVGGVFELRRHMLREEGDMGD
mmetsp:Transcript_82543/g.191796  ORF Transcript_82543/g.191796 Transcript_82543/m.191796 type:complete len:217 (-) Transcript_82543:423-1073(-)